VRASGGGIAGRIKGSGPLGWLLLAIAAAAVVLLVVADFSTLSFRTIGEGACDDRTQAPDICRTVAHAQHGYALVILAAVAALMAWGAVIGRSRAAAVALVAIGVTVLGIALIGDYPERGDKRGLEAKYTDVSAKLGPAFKLELAGAVLLVLVGGLALGRPAASEPWRRRERDRARPRPRAEDFLSEPPPMPDPIAPPPDPAAPPEPKAQPTRSDSPPPPQQP
jgi:hypothetical protein